MLILPTAPLDKRHNLPRLPSDAILLDCLLSTCASQFLAVILTVMGSEADV